MSHSSANEAGVILGGSGGTMDPGLPTYWAADFCAVDTTTAGGAAEVTAAEAGGLQGEPDELQ
jgi:hypothetical protein